MNNFTSMVVRDARKFTFGRLRGAFRTFGDEPASSSLPTTTLSSLLAVECAGKEDVVLQVDVLVQ